MIIRYVALVFRFKVRKAHAFTQKHQNKKKKIKPFHFHAIQCNTQIEIRKCWMLKVFMNINNNLFLRTLTITLGKLITFYALRIARWSAVQSVCGQGLRSSAKTDNNKKKIFLQKINSPWSEMHLFDCNPFEQRSKSVQIFRQIFRFQVTFCKTWKEMH